MRRRSRAVVRGHAEILSSNAMALENDDSEVQDHCEQTIKCDSGHYELSIVCVDAEEVALKRVV
jgi:hypothetical protein